MRTCKRQVAALTQTEQNGLLLQPVFTKKLLLRGQYQTLPLAVYGWAMPVQAAVKVCHEKEACQNARIACQLFFLTAVLQC